MVLILWCNQFIIIHLNHFNMNKNEKTVPAQEKAEAKKPVSQVNDLQKVLREKLEAIQKLNGLYEKHSGLSKTLQKLQEFKYSSTRTNDILTLKDGETYNKEFTTSNIFYVEKVQRFLIEEIKKEIEETETQIQAATL